MGFFSKKEKKHQHHHRDYDQTGARGECGQIADKYKRIDGKGDQITDDIQLYSQQKTDHHTGHQSGLNRSFYDGLLGFCLFSSLLSLQVKPPAEQLSVTENLQKTP